MKKAIYIVDTKGRNSFSLSWILHFLENEDSSKFCVPAMQFRKGEFKFSHRYLLFKNDLSLFPIVSRCNAPTIVMSPALSSEDFSKVIDNFKNDCEFHLIFPLTDQITVFEAISYRILGSCASENVENFLESVVFNYKRYLDSLEMLHKKSIIHTVFDENIFDCINYLTGTSFHTNKNFPTIKGLCSREALHFRALISNFCMPHEFRDIQLALQAAESSHHGQLAYLPLASSQDRQRIRAHFAEENSKVARCFFDQDDLFPVMADPHEESWTPYSGLTHHAAAHIISAIPEYLQYKLANRMEYGCLPLLPTQEIILDELRKSLPSTSYYPVLRGQVVKSTPKVTVLTLSCNHEKFIAKNIESVLEQKTSFPIEHIILDDASNDVTTDIISQYAIQNSSIKPIFITKKCSGENVHALFSACKSQYAALCDGDDYFTDPYKLQKQADYLDAHPECSMCFHQVRVVYEDGTDRERLYPPLKLMPRGVRPFYYLADLFKANFIQTNAVMYRWRFQGGLPEWFRAELVPGDWYWHLLHAEKGKIGFLDGIMSVYRRHKKSLYYTAENPESTVPHRLLHGMRELDTYAAINEHFERRYERAIMGFTNNLLVDFLMHSQKTGDDSLLHKAGEAYPQFMEYFLRNVSLVRGTSSMHENIQQGTIPSSDNQER